MGSITGHTSPATFRALVARPPHVDGKMDLNLEHVRLRAVAADEVLVKIVATGICQSDLHSANQPASTGIYPRVLGHEGAGYAIQVGSAVSVVKPGDRLLLAYPGCGTCRRCSEGHPCFCTVITNKHLNGDKGVFHTVVAAAEDDADDNTKSNSESVYGSFHGQSSFANYTIVKEGAVVNAEGLVENEEELKLFAPVVCGFQTGAGSIMSVARGRKEDSVVVTGLGGVGLGAILAAKVLGCKTIIGVDLHQSRLDAALTLGATHVLQSSGADFDLVHEVQQLTAGCGASIVLDSTGLVALIEAGVAVTEDGGRFVHVGVPQPITAELKISLIQFLATGRSFMASKAGDVVPRKFLPQMIQWYRDGLFPLKELITYYPVDDYYTAIQDMKDGKAIKTVLVW